MIKLIKWIIRQGFISLIFGIVLTVIYAGMTGQPVSLLCIGSSSTSCLITPVDERRAILLQSAFSRGGETAQKMVSDFQQ